MKRTSYAKLAKVSDLIGEPVMVTIDEKDTPRETCDVLKILDKHFALHEADAISRGIFSDDAYVDDLENLIEIIRWHHEQEEYIPELAYDLVEKYILNFES